MNRKSIVYLQLQKSISLVHKSNCETSRIFEYAYTDHLTTHRARSVENAFILIYADLGHKAEKAEFFRFHLKSSVAVDIVSRKRKSDTGSSRTEKELSNLVRNQHRKKNQLFFIIFGLFGLKIFDISEIFVVLYIIGGVLQAGSAPTKTTHFVNDYRSGPQCFCFT